MWATARTWVFPDHWSVWLGQIVVACFVIVVLSGLFLWFCYDPSAAKQVYAGSYRPLRGMRMSSALASVLNISFDVRCGLLVRQIHHWASLLAPRSICRTC